ncbi:MAG: hypothetical protein DRN17_00575 [Thermoplasmata archaeon]|nr:MAG: hypothetical protein DRN17_00575 [Thermoplasmata archaeon]
MLLVNDEIKEYQPAVSMLNYDKLGHETGLGARGILFTISDGFPEDLTIFIGLKFDVLTVVTNRFISTFVNIPRTTKESIPYMKSNQNIEIGLTGNDFDGEDIELTFYIDIHKITINIPKMAHHIYGFKDTCEEYVALAKDKAMKMKGRRTSRGISAKMQRVYDGNLENFGFIFTKTEVLHILNELIIDKDIIHDEIKYTYWLTPHDRLDYNFLHSGEIAPEPGSEYVTGLGKEFLFKNKTHPMFSYDRRGMRSGYYDVTVKDPTINTGYNDGVTEIQDTFVFTSDNTGKFHKHNASADIFFSFRHRLDDIAKAIIDAKSAQAVMNIVNKLMTSAVRRAIYETTEMRVKDGFIAKLDELMLDKYIPSIVDDIEDQLAISRDRAEALLMKVHLESTVVPLFLMNMIYSDEPFNVAALEDSVLFIYHPILNKFVYYDVGENDAAVIESDKILFFSDGTRYGIDTSGSDNVLLWSNIEKRSRNISSKWYNMLGTQTDIGEENEPVIDLVLQKFNSTELKLLRFDDLCIDGKCAQIISVNRGDVKAMIKKTTGEFTNEFALGRKSGDITISRDGLWM